MRANLRIDIAVGIQDSAHAHHLKTRFPSLVQVVFVIHCCSIVQHRCDPNPKTKPLRWRHHVLHVAITRRSFRSKQHKLLARTAPHRGIIYRVHYSKIAVRSPKSCAPVPLTFENAQTPSTMLTPVAISSANKAAPSMST